MPSNAFPELRRRLLAAGATLAFAFAGAPAAEAQIFGMSEKKEIEIGQRMHVQVLQTMGAYDNPELQAYVDSIGQRLAKLSDRPKLQYTFTVVDTEDVNAFAIPGGFIYISRGILPYLSNEAELAAVLGHEIGHVTARHAARQQSQGTLAGLAGIATAVLTGQPALAELTNVAGAAIVRGYGRDMELEADRIGAQLLAKAGYDPQAIISVVSTLKDQERWEVDSARLEGRQPRLYHGLFATHPAADTRLREAVTAARKVATTATGTVSNQEQFLRRLDGVSWGPSREQGVLRGSRMYHAGMGFTVAFPSGWNVENGRDRVVATSPRRDATMMLQTQAIPPQLQEPRSFVARGMLAGAPLRDARDLEVNGNPAFTAVTRMQTPFGQRPARVVVVKFNNLYWTFVGASRGAGQVPDADRLFLSAAQTLRRLRSDELGLAEPNRIRIVTAQSGATVEQIARETPLTRYPVQQIRLFNRLYPSGEPQPGQLVKTVR
ncbi:MAG: M48 family metalloprotease [Steroidobacteraceae bacterium]|jgi:predicted Zn-dependent protease|nr:M48 family metalloprotease [Steroidobacteraceae bacterium]